MAGTFTGPKKPTSFDELVAFLEADYRKKQNKSLRRALQCVGHLREAFERTPAAAITYERMDAYVMARLDAGAKNATVRQEIAILGRMLTLAVRAGRLGVRPQLPEINLQNTREGFFEPEQLQALLPHLPEQLRPVALFAYLTGWRRGEVLSLRWADVDFAAQVVRLEPGSTKNREGRVFPFGTFPELAALLREQRESTDRLQRATGQIVPWVFHRAGQPLRDFYGAWRAACKAAGVPGRIFHDFRRTAVRNLERAGVPRSVAMKLTGHKTEAVYRRYAIVDERDLAEGVAKLAAIHLGTTQVAGARVSSERSG
jgi:integrase